MAFTVENLELSIPVGIYPAYKRDSVRLGKRVIGIDVPNRTDIEIHTANMATQLRGCVAPGESIDGDALDNSTSAFERLMAAVPETFTVEVL